MQITARSILFFNVLLVLALGLSACAGAAPGAGPGTGTIQAPTAGATGTAANTGDTGSSGSTGAATGTVEAGVTSSTGGTGSSGNTGTATGTVEAGGAGQAAETPSSGGTAESNAGATPAATAAVATSPTVNATLDQLSGATSGAQEAVEGTTTVEATLDRLSEADRQAQNTNTSQGEVRASELMAYGLKNAQGEQIGQVQDLLIGLLSRRVNYAVVSLDKPAGSGASWLAIPMNAMKFADSSAAGAFSFNVDESALQAAPGFDQNNWPDTTQPGWDEEVRTYWQGKAIARDGNSTTPQATGTPEVVKGQSTPAASEPAVRASQLIDFSINDPNGGVLGQVEDLMISPASDQVDYAIVSFSGLTGKDKQLFTVPLAALNLDQANIEQQALNLGLDPQMLQNIPGFDPNAWPDTTQPGWDEEARDFWNRLAGEATNTQ